MSDIGITYQLDIEVLTPLHVGSGTKLLEGFDFARHNGRVYRLDVDRILTDRWPDDAQQQELLMSQPPAALLTSKDFQSAPAYFIYSLAGEPALREIIECIRDAQGRAYLPGSSLKGALRTSLLRALIEREKAAIDESDVNWRHDDQRVDQAAKVADDRIEKKWLGNGPNDDLLRAVQISDTAPVPSAALKLQRVQMVPNLDLDVEAIERQTHLIGELHIDTWLLRQDGVSWSENARDVIRRMPAYATRIAGRRIVQELEYHQRRREAQAATFYGKLGEELASGNWPKNQFVIQAGFATGWRSKSALGNLPDDSELLEKVVHGFQLDRGGGKGRGYVRGQAFPKARHLAYIGNVPTLPMGWLKVTMTET
jgi:CRISPR-associated protein Csm5